MTSYPNTHGGFDAAHRARLVKSRLTGRGINVALSGIDGAGKSTLSRQLRETLMANGVAVECFHIYHWYDHLLKTPWLVLGNRYFYRRVFIFDRTYHDNLAVFFSGRSQGFLRLLAIAVNMAYPKFDYVIHILASFKATILRRPEMDRGRFEQLFESYAVVMGQSDSIHLKSDEYLFQATLDLIADYGVATSE